MSSVNSFCNGIQVVLPKFQLIGDVLESCGLLFEINFSTGNFGDCTVGCNWYEEGIQLNLQFMLKEHEIVSLNICENDGNEMTLQAQNVDGVAQWSILFPYTLYVDSPLIELEEDIRRLIGDMSKRDEVILEDESHVREIVNMFAVVYKQYA